MMRQRSRSFLRFSQHPVEGSATINAERLVMINSAGYAVEAAATPTPPRGCVGVAVATIDNSAGAAGALNVVVEEGIFTLTATGMVPADLHTAAYASSGSLVSGTDAGSEPAAGRITRYRSATEVDVLVSTEAVGGIVGAI